MIPEAAVEAAARLLWARDGELINEVRPSWDDIATLRNPVWSAVQEDTRQDARAALEAAAPHMLAEAFDQGQKSGMRHADRLVAAAKIGRPELPGPISPNPYRPTP